MFDDIKKFLNGKDQTFIDELNKINNQNTQVVVDEGQGDEAEKFQIINKYKQTDAYKRLLKRQGQAVRRIEKIKENFGKKRKQVTMLAVHRDQQRNHNLNLIDQQKEEQDLVEYESRRNGSHTNADQRSPLISENSQSRPQTYNSSKQRPILSNQTPLSQSVILEERSSIGTIAVNEKNIHLQGLHDDGTKHKKMKMIEPYMKSCQQYFKKLNKQAQASNQKKQQSMGQHYDLSHHFHQSSGNISNSPNSVSQKLNMSETSYLTGMQTYQNEILRNKRAQKSVTFYKASLIQRNQPSQLVNRSTANASRGAVDQRSYLISRAQKHRPQTTSKGNSNGQFSNFVQIDIRSGNISVGEQQIEFQRALSGEGSRQNIKTYTNDDIQIKIQNKHLPSIQNTKEQLQQPLIGNYRPSHIKEEVKEQEEEQEESRQQSQIQTITNKLDEQPRQKMIIDVLSSKGSQFYHSSESRTLKEEFLKSLKINTQKSEGSQGQRRKLKNQTPVQSYNIMKNQIIQNIKSKQYWPANIRHPDEYRGFYWTPDMSFCGFASNSNQQQSSQLKKRNSSKNPAMSNSIFKQYQSTAKEEANDQ